MTEEKSIIDGLVNQLMNSNKRREKQEKMLCYVRNDWIGLWFFDIIIGNMVIDWLEQLLSWIRWKKVFVFGYQVYLEDKVANLLGG